MFVHFKFEHTGKQLLIRFNLPGTEGFFKLFFGIFTKTCVSIRYSFLSTHMSSVLSSMQFGAMNKNLTVPLRLETPSERDMTIRTGRNDRGS